MISFDGFAMTDSSPIYQQLILFVKRGMAAGTIRDGDELPSRRALSALLGVNPNTIQKACRSLEEEGLLMSRTGAKSFASLPPGTVERIRRELLREDIAGIISAMKQTGVSCQDAVRMIETMWEETL